MDRFSITYHKGKYSKGLLVICCVVFASFPLQAREIATPHSKPEPVPLKNDSLIEKAEALELVDRVVAEVNSTPILYSEIQEKVENGPLVKISDYPADRSDPAFDHALNDAINLRLVLAYAEQLEMEVSDADVQKHIDLVAKQNNIDATQLQSILQQQGKSFAAYKNDIRDQILFMRFRGRVLMPLVKITDRDVEAYYVKKIGPSADAVSLKLRSIFLSYSANTGANYRIEMEKLAQEVFSKLKNGMNFYEAEKIYSEQTAGGESKPSLLVGLQDLDEKIREKVKPLDEKAFTEPIVLDHGIYIFYLEEKQFSGNQEFATKKAQLENELRRNELIEQMQRWLKEERQKSKIRILKG